MPPSFMVVRKIGLEEKKRLYTLLKKVGIVLLVGAGYAVFVKLTGWGIPCVFRLLTGLECPGCGISRMFLALLRFDVGLAAKYNLLVLCLLPVGLILFLYKSWQYIKTGSNDMAAWEKGLYIAAFVLCIVFTVLRNTNWIPFLHSV